MIPVLLAILTLSVIAVLSLAFKLYGYQKLCALQGAAIEALLPVAKASHEYIVFMLTAQTQDHPPIHVVVSGPQAEDYSDMYKTRFNAIASKLNALNGGEEVDIVVIERPQRRNNQEDQ